LTRVALVVVLCLVFVSVVYGFSVALSASLSIETLEKNVRATHDQMLVYGLRSFVPTGDPIDNPKPNGHNRFG